MALVLVLSILAASCGSNPPAAPLEKKSKTMNPAEPRPVVPSRPASAAIIIHEASGDQVATVDLSTGKVDVLATGVSTPKGLSISADGKWIVYASGRVLWLYGGDGSPAHSLFDALDVTADPPYAFQPGADTIAVAAHGGVQLLSLSGTSASSLRFPLADGCRVSQLRWAKNGEVLYALCAPPLPEKQPWIVAVTPAKRATRVLPAPGVSRLLGFGAAGELIVSRTAGAGDEALMAGSAGDYRSIRPAKENEFIFGYIGGPTEAAGRYVVLQGSEDGGDRTVFCLADAGPCSPWLSAFRRVADLSFSSDGEWALFIERPEVEGDLPGGDVYLAATHGAETRRILQATRDRSFSSPVIRPGAF